jgi:multiple antibiotic resistance protein
MTLIEYTFLAFTSLFIVIDPIATAPVFIAMTETDTTAARIRMARLASLVAAGVLMLFALTGQGLFKVLGVTLPAFQIAGSLLLMRIALDMVYARRSDAKQTDEEVEAGVLKDDIAITPLGVPMLAGPGAISTALILLAQARGPAQHIALFACILTVCGLSYVTLAFAAKHAGRLNPLALKLITRLMGLLLAAVAVQFALTGLEQSRLFDR